MQAPGCSPPGPRPRPERSRDRQGAVGRPCDWPAPSRSRLGACNGEGGPVLGEHPTKRLLREIADMQLPRASGILLHPTSLPGRYGIGDLGPEAHRFLDFLADTGQTWWQVLPLGPVGYGGSPYQSPLSLACSPLLISLDLLAARGWLDTGKLAAIPPLPAHRLDFDPATVLH